MSQTTTKPPEKRKSGIMIPLVLSLTLGLAPFVPEPHLVGKIRWVIGGAVGMAPMDYFDLVLHGFPWVMLVIAISRWVLDKTRKHQTASGSTV